MRNILTSVVHFHYRILNYSLALENFGCGNDILFVEPLIGLIDGGVTFLEVEVRWGQNQQLSLSNISPTKHLRATEGQQLIHHSLGKLGVFLPGPEQHLLSFFCPRVARLPGRVKVQTIKQATWLKMALSWERICQ